MSEEEVASEAEVLAAVDLDDSAEQEGADELEEGSPDDDINEGDQELLAEAAHITEEEPSVDAPAVSQKMLRLQAATSASFPASYAANTEFGPPRAVRGVPQRARRAQAAVLLHQAVQAAVQRALRTQRLRPIFL